MQNRRFFVRIAYRGTNFHGFQRQENAMTVQQSIEEHLSTFLRTEISIVGCGRTDTGVHASTYYFHFDLEQDLPQRFRHRINKFLPADIAVQSVREVANDAHARFDAIERAYEYRIYGYKNPFSCGLKWFFPQIDKLDLEKLQIAANFLTEYDEFYPFCKTDTDVHTMKCDLMSSYWEIRSGPHPEMVYHVRANRFLRGMVRLIVGMCINIGLGKIDLEEVKQALDNQEHLSKSLSVPPDGLFLTDVVYPFPVD